MNFGTTDNPDIVDFKIYLYADKLVEEIGINRREVYIYEDLTGDNTISKAEWESQIINKHLEIFSTRRYRFAHNMDVNFVEVDPLTNDRYVTVQTFFVYTIVDNVDSNYITDAIKSYLLSEHEISYCIEHYPDLFSGTVVNVIPIDNTGIGSVMMVPVTLGKINETLISNGYRIGDQVTPADNNVKNCEIVYVGNETTSVANPVPMPLIVISSEKDDIVRPISTPFSTYIPRYVPFDGYVDEAPNPSKPKTFHHLLYISLMVVTGVIDPDTISIMGSNEEADAATGISIPNYIGFSVNRDDNDNIVKVVFNMGGIEYDVYPLS